MPSIEKAHSFSELLTSKLVFAAQMFSPTRRLHSEKFEKSEVIDEEDSFLNVSSSSNMTSTPTRDPSDSNFKVAWRGRRAAANAFHLPVVNKRNLFSLSWNLESQLNDFQAKFANNFSHSSALRCAFFDTLASSFISGRWFSEAAVCQAHCIAIIGKELVEKNEITVDWSCLDMINENIAMEENVFEIKRDESQYAGYTIENFTSKIEETLPTLVLSERYEAVGPLCRIITPIYEKNHSYKALINIYAELQQACTRAEELKINGKRHLGTYFRVIFYGGTHFGNEHKSEWIYREPHLTSLSEACVRMVESAKHALGHDHVEILPPKKDFDESKLKKNIAYIQITHVEPCFVHKDVLENLSKKNENLLKITNNKNEFIGLDGIEFGAGVVDDPMSYKLHTNVKTFLYEEHFIETIEKNLKNASEQSRLAVKRTVLTVEKSFPNTSRRQRVVERKELILSPLEVACNSLIFKAWQIHKILVAAGFKHGTCEIDKASLQRLDLKQLQLFLQGSVSPTVNAGVLAYAEAFTAPSQLLRYGPSGIAKLVSAFNILISECSEALRVNEAAIGNERGEYQSMLQNSFDQMKCRLSVLFSREKFAVSLNNAKIMNESKKKRENSFSKNKSSYNFNNRQNELIV